MRHLLLAALLFLATGGYAQECTVLVKNSLPVQRALETVELAWSDVVAKIPDATAKNIVVTDSEGKQIPSQVVFNGEKAPQMLIFQATVAPKSSSSYSLAVGARDKYFTKAFGRFVPERMDDYAWENNMAAYRLYGPKLTDPVSPGIDVWVKRTQKMVINNWYKIGDYHHDSGQGMDCYKVGITLGGGASAPFVDGKLWLSANYATQKRLDNGPIRTTVRLTYAPFDVAGQKVSLEKIISLDANTPFSKMTNIYSGTFAKLPVAAGIVMHTVKDKTFAKDYITITEEVSDSKQPKEDGDISLAVIMPKAASTTEAEGHALIVGYAKSGSPLVYWSGAGWSKSWVKDAAAWDTYVKEAAAKLQSPLKVTIK